MIKHFFTLLFISFFSLLSYGQLPDGFVAPDFTATDINGQEHNLYELLDEGKTVILDIYATWCGPCWTFHSDHVLADIWDELGPDGTNEVFIFSIENDLSTTLDDLYGTGSSTLGNWVDDTPYPMIDETEGGAIMGTIGSDYLILGFPTIYFICPDRSVTELGWQVVESQYSGVIASCPEAQGDNNLNIKSYSGIEGVVCEAVDFTPSISFQNYGSQTVTSATFGLTINGTTEQLNWEGNLNTFQFAELDFSDVTADNTDILIEVIDVNSQPDNFPEGNTLETSILLPLITEMDTVTIEIMTDTYGVETYWAVLDDNDEIVAEGGNLAVGLNVTVDSLGLPEPPSAPNAYGSNTLYTTEVHLPTNGCYRLIVADYYRDGMCCNFGNGYFKVISQDNDVLVDGGGFEHRSENPFARSGTVSTEQAFLTEIKTIPNPVINELTIEIPNSSPPIQHIHIFDVQGKTILNMTSINDNQINLDMSSLHSGLYLLELRFEDGNSAQRKIVKQ